MTRQSACKFLETDVVGALAATGLVALFGVMDQISLAIVFCASLLGGCLGKLFWKPKTAS